MAPNVVRVGDIEITQLSDGMLGFDLCNFFPTIDESNWSPYESHLHEHKFRFNLGSYLIRGVCGKTILVDTGLGPPARRDAGRAVGPAHMTTSSQRAFPAEDPWTWW